MPYLLQVSRPLAVYPVLLTAGVQATSCVSGLTATDTGRCRTNGVGGGAASLGVSSSDTGARAP